MRKVFIVLGMSLSLLIGCGEENNSNATTTSKENAEISHDTSSSMMKESDSTQEHEVDEPVNKLSSNQRKNITEVAGELDEALTYYQARYVENSHAIVVLIDDNVILNEYLRAIEGEQAYVDAFQSTGNTLQDTSRKIVRDSNVDDLELIFAAPLEDNNAAIIFRFENGERIIDVFEELGYY